MENILNDLYYNIWDENSFRGLYLLLKSAKQFNLTRDDIKSWLESQPTYTKFQHPKTKFARNPVVSKHINHIWFSDLIYIKYPNHNDGYKYILLVIDNLSKKGYAQPIKNKTQDTIKRAFLDIFNDSNAIPSIIITDPGPEFTNDAIKLLFDLRHIKHIILRDGSKASVVERWARTLKNIIQKYLHANNSKRYIHVLQDIVDNYNRTIHSRTKFRPMDVNQTNQREVYQNLYRIKRTRENQKFKVGDRVRVALVRPRLGTSFKPKFSNEIFVIHKIYQTFPYYKYRIRDIRGGFIRGSYYSSELIKVT